MRGTVITVLRVQGDAISGLPVRAYVTVGFNEKSLVPNLSGLGPREPVGQNSVKSKEQIQVPMYYREGFRRKSLSTNLN